MPTLIHSFQYALSHSNELVNALGQHLLLVGSALGISIGICLPLGIWTSRAPSVAAGVMNVMNVIRVVPSLAILFLAIPYLGLTFASAVVALTVLAIPPVLINTDAAFRLVDGAVREAALGMGMTKWQVLRCVEFPLALPVIIAGIRTATVEVIASATLAAFVGVGGFGLYVIRGFALYDNGILLVGAIPVALLALLAEWSLSVLQRAVALPA